MDSDKINEQIDLTLKRLEEDLQRVAIPLEIRKKYNIDEGDSVIYVDLGDHIAIVPVTKNALKDLKDLKVDAKQAVSEMRKEALETAQRLVDKKFNLPNRIRPVAGYH